MAWFNYNGKMYKDAATIIGADNRGLRFGDGVFETMKMKNDLLILDNEHFARLWKGMAVLQFAIPNDSVSKFTQDVPLNLSTYGFASACIPYVT